MSNLYKSRNVVSKEERVIDYNEVIKSKIQKILDSTQSGKVEADGFVSGLNAQIVESLLSPNIDALLSDNTNSGHVFDDLDIACTAESSADIIECANRESESIINEANRQANLILEKAYIEGKEKGLSEAQKEIQENIHKVQMEYQQKELTLQQQYEDLKSKMEPELVSVISDLFKNIISAISEDNEDMILNLVNSVMRKVEVSREFVIKVSPSDYKFLINNQGKIYCSMSKDVQIEIIQDESLKANQCIIESDIGVYDCSLDIQLKNLIKDIKILSCI